jgi:hypothetical protein
MQSSLLPCSHARMLQSDNLTRSQAATAELPVPVERRSLGGLAAVQSVMARDSDECAVVPGVPGGTMITSGNAASVQLQVRLPLPHAADALATP